MSTRGFVAAGKADGAVAWRLERSARGVVTCTATLPDGTAQKRIWNSLDEFLTAIDEWVAEIARSAPTASVVSQDWPASRPTWPWPEKVSAEREWLDFLAAWRKYLGDKPARNGDLIALAKRHGLLTRFLADPGYTGVPELRLAIVLRSLSKPWHGHRVITQSNGQHLLLSAPESDAYQEALAALLATGEHDRQMWARADAALRATRSLGRRTAAKLAAETGLSASYIRELVDTARTFPPGTRNAALSFTHHKMAAMTKDPHKELQRAATMGLQVGKHASHITMRLRDEELRRIDEMARHYNVTRSAFIRIRVLGENTSAAVQPPAAPRPSHLDPHNLETLSANAPLSHFWHILSPWAERLGPEGAAWFRQWPLAPEVMERIEAVWPFLTQH